jgi:hypothetical protein
MDFTLLKGLSNINVNQEKYEIKETECMWLWKLNKQMVVQCYRQKLWRKSKHTVYVQQFSSENHAICKVMWRNMLEPDRPQVTV